MFNITASKVYEWIGRIVFWGGLVFFVLFQAYSLGVHDALMDGYILGWADARSGLPLVDPRLPFDQRLEEFKKKTAPEYVPKKQSNKSPSVQVKGKEGETNVVLYTWETPDYEGVRMRTIWESAHPNTYSTRYSYQR